MLLIAAPLAAWVIWRGRASPRQWVAAGCTALVYGGGAIFALARAVDALELAPGEAALWLVVAAASLLTLAALVVTLHAHALAQLRRRLGPRVRPLRQEAEERLQIMRVGAQRVR